LKVLNHILWVYLIAYQNFKFYLTKLTMQLHYGLEQRLLQEMSFQMLLSSIHFQFILKNWDPPLMTMEIFWDLILLIIVLNKMFGKLKINNKNILNKFKTIQISPKLSNNLPDKQNNLVFHFNLQQNIMTIMNVNFI
jgi:hypothetical protein